MFGNLLAIEYIPFASVPTIPLSINLSDKLIIIHDKLFGTNGIEYLSISDKVFLLKSFLLMNCGKCNFTSTIKAVALFAIVFDHKSPFTPSLKLTINRIFNAIVDAPKIKFESSPTPPVDDLINRFIKFLIKHTKTPLTGPYANDAISAGSSETSNLIKLGMNFSRRNRGQYD